MSSFKKADGIIDSIQKQAAGLRTLDGSAIEDFLSIAGYEDPAEGSGGGAVIITDDGTALDKTYAEIYDLIESETPCYISYTVGKSLQDLDSDYTYSVNLLPVVAVSKYDTVYRVYASATKGYVVQSNTVGLPSVWTYSAASSQEYPSFFRQVYVNPGNVSVAVDRVT